MNIGQSTDESPRDLKKLSITQNSVKNHQVTLMWKTLKTEKYVKFAIEIYAILIIEKAKKQMANDGRKKTITKKSERKKELNKF